MNSSLLASRPGFYDDWTLLLLVREVFFNVSYLQAGVRSFLTKCCILFIDEYPPKTEDSSRLTLIWYFHQSCNMYHVCSKILNIAEGS